MRKELITGCTLLFCGMAMAVPIVLLVVGMGTIVVEFAPVTYTVAEEVPLTVTGIRLLYTGILALAPPLHVGGEQLATTPVLPAPTPVMSPVVLTDATVGLEDRYVSTRPVPVMGLFFTSVT